MSNWQPLKISDLGRVVTGKTPPTESTEYYDGDELFASPRDLTWNSYYVESTATRISEKALHKFKGQLIPRDSVMFTSLSFAFGKMGIASRSCITNQQINSVIVNDRHCARFVYYLLRAYEPYIFAYNSGIDTPIVPKSVFERIPVLVPGKATQEKIASLLSSYDDLIANNQRRIALLESMAEEIYREWFVRMRFPGAAAVGLEGGIPIGWRVCSIADLFVTSSGGTPSRSNPANFSGAIPWVKTGELKQTFISATEERISETALESSAAKLLPARTIVMAMYCAMPDVAVLDVAAATNQACCALTPKSNRLGMTWSYFFARNALGQLVNFAHGAAQQNLSQEIIRRFRVLAPEESLIERFGLMVDPMFEEVSVLYRQNAILRANRDALLPRLISGKLRVDHLDIHMPPSMKAALAPVD